MTEILRKQSDSRPLLVVLGLALLAKTVIDPHLIYAPIAWVVYLAVVWRQFTEFSGWPSWRTVGRNALFVGAWVSVGMIFLISAPIVAVVLAVLCFSMWLALEVDEAL